MFNSRSHFTIEQLQRPTWRWTFSAECEILKIRPQGNSKVRTHQEVRVGESHGVGEARPQQVRHQYQVPLLLRPVHARAHPAMKYIFVTRAQQPRYMHQVSLRLRAIHARAHPGAEEEIILVAARESSGAKLRGLLSTRYRFASSQARSRIRCEHSPVAAERRRRHAPHCAEPHPDNDIHIVAYACTAPCRHRPLQLHEERAGRARHGAPECAAGQQLSAGCRIVLQGLGLCCRVAILTAGFSPHRTDSMPASGSGKGSGR